MNEKAGLGLKGFRNIISNIKQQSKFCTEKEKNLCIWK